MVISYLSGVTNNLKSSDWLTMMGPSYAKELPGNGQRTLTE
jgi:hypothetical protein